MDCGGAAADVRTTHAATPHTRTPLLLFNDELFSWLPLLLLPPPYFTTTRPKCPATTLRSKDEHLKEQAVPPCRKACRHQPARLPAPATTTQAAANAAAPGTEGQAFRSEKAAPKPPHRRRERRSMHGGCRGRNSGSTWSSGLFTSSPRLTRMAGEEAVGRGRPRAERGF